MDHKTITDFNSDKTVKQNEFLVFNLGDEEYAIEILKVHEIKSYEATTHLVNLPAYINGIINIRGNIVPVIDMRVLFHMEQVTYKETTIMIILDLHGSLVGIVVDTVTDVLTLLDNEIKSASGFNLVIASDYIKGVGVIPDHMLIILDIDKIITKEDLKSITMAY